MERYFRTLYLELWAQELESLKPLEHSDTLLKKFEEKIKPRLNNPKIQKQVEDAFPPLAPIKIDSPPKIKFEDVPWSLPWDPNKRFYDERET